MAVVTTYALVEVYPKEPPTPEYSPGLSSFTPVDNSPPVDAYESAGAQHGDVTSTLPISEVAETSQSWRHPTFLDDFYYRIHIRPGVIVLGNLLSAQVRTVEVWSGYFDPKLLSSLSIVGTDGIMFT